ncbi:MAG: adenylate kinase [Chloroflexota bacterium]|nr:adenylate kinase [Chloroflexota bacterium]
MENTKPFSSVDLQSLLRVNVIGTSGVGKSTFANQLAEVLAIPYIEMDALYWLPNWEEPSDNDFFTILDEQLKRDAWVLDGNYSRTTAIKWGRVQTIIWLDYSFLRAIYQVVTRAFERSWTQSELWPHTGNRESFRKCLFSRDSIILWTLITYRRRRKNYTALMKNANYPNIDFLRFCSPKHSQAFLAHLQTLVDRDGSKRS